MFSPPEETRILRRYETQKKRQLGYEVASSMGRECDFKQWSTQLSLPPIFRRCTMSSVTVINRHFPFPLGRADGMMDGRGRTGLVIASSSRPPARARPHSFLARVVRQDDSALCGMREGNIVPTHRPRRSPPPPLRCDVGAGNKHLGNY